MSSGVVSDLLCLCGPYIFHAGLGSHAPPLKCSLDLTWLHLRLYHLLEGGHISQLAASHLRAGLFIWDPSLCCWECRGGQEPPELVWKLLCEC